MLGTMRLVLLCLCGAFLAAGELKVPEDAVFAVVVRNGGSMKSLGHDHFVHIPKYQAKLAMASEQLESLAFSMTFKVRDLVVDDPTQAGKWSSEMVRLKIIDEAFSEKSQKTRRKIRKAMLGKKQLKVDSFPDMAARLISLKPGSKKVGDKSFSHVALLELTILGKAVKKEVGVNLTRKDGVLKVHALGMFLFSDFGMEPFSAMFGAVANKDGFYVLVDFSARLSQ